MGIIYDIECAILELNVFVYLEIALGHFFWDTRGFMAIRIVPWRNYMRPGERSDVAVVVDVLALWSVVIVSCTCDHGIGCRFCLEIICSFTVLLRLIVIWSSGLSIHPKSTLCFCLFGKAWYPSRVAAF